MPLTKEEINTEILSDAKKSDKILPEMTVEIRKRHLDSVHPLDCSCKIHLDQRKLDVLTAKSELETREKLDYYTGN